MLRLLVAVALAGLMSGVLPAQDVGPQAAILDSLSVRLRVAAAHRQAFDDSLARARQVLDTVRAGPLTVFVSPGQREITEAALRITLDSLETLGDRMVASLRGTRFVLRRVPPQYWQAADARPIAVVLLDHNDIEQYQYLEQEPRAELLAAYFIDHSRRRLVSLLNPSLGQWVGGVLGTAAARFDSVTTFTWTQLRLDLVSATSPVPRRCYEGSLRDCRHVLGFDSVPSPVRDYYDAVGRRYMVQRHAEQLGRRDYARTSSCLAGNDSACVSALERSVVDVSIASLGHRMALFQLAVQHGGADAGARALSATGTPAQQLEAISRVPVDSLIAAWHARVRNERIASDNMSTGMALASFGWVTILGALALRNKRWR